jgi:hypothetical protein
MATACGGVNTTWPRHDQITNSYFWNNQFNGAGYSYPTAYDRVPAGYFQEGRDYWLRPPQTGDALQSYRPLVYPHPLVAAEP